MARYVAADTDDRAGAEGGLAVTRSSDPLAALTTRDPAGLQALSRTIGNRATGAALARAAHRPAAPPAALPVRAHDARALSSALALAVQRRRLEDEPARLLARAPKDNPGGGCGVCSSPESAGKKAHAFLQGLAAQATDLECTGELCLGNAGKIERRVDIVRQRAGTWNVDIGEIKPNNEDGVKAGREILETYEQWIRENRPGIEVGRIETWPAAKSMPFIDFRSPNCPQALNVIEAGNGLFLYDCEPKKEALEDLPQCKCGKSKRTRPVNWQGVAVALAIAAAVAAAAKMAKAAQEKILEEFAKRALLSMSEQMAEQAAKQFAKKAAAVLAYVEMAAAFILLFVSDARAEVGPGESPIQTLAETMGRNGAPMPDDLKALIEGDPDLKAQVERGLQNHDSSEQRDALNGRMVQLLDEHASEFTPDEIRRILALTHATSNATDGTDMTLARLHEIAKMRSVGESGDGGRSGSGSGGSAPGDGAAGRQDGNVPGAGGGPFPGGGGTGIPQSDDELGDGEDSGGSDWDETEDQGGGADGRQDGGTGQPGTGAAGQPGTGAAGQPGSGPSGQPGTGQAGTTDQADGTRGQTGAPGQEGGSTDQGADRPGGEGPGGTTDQGDGAGGDGPGGTTDQGDGAGGDGPGGTTDQGDGPGGTSDQEGSGGKGSGGGAGDGNFATSTGVEKTGKTPAPDAKTQAGMESTEQNKFGAEIPADMTYLMVPAGTKLASGKALMVMVMGRDASSILFIGKGKMVPHQSGDGWSVTMPAGIALYSSGGRYGQTRRTEVPVTNPELLP